MFKYGLLILILCFTSCKPLGKAVTTVLADMMTPVFNPDLLQLQYGLYQYKLLNPTWPQDSIVLNEFLKYVDLEPIRNSKYEILEWSSKSESVDVVYLLRYNELDSIQFNSIKGGFNLSLDNDSALHSVHRNIIAEKKNNTSMKLNGEWKMKIDKPKK
ncbi:MAG: hypothetical protein M3512_03310 [Bacteroidota bacterium]|nr:hypothetical protein [Bacteroidota bacterium]